MKMIQRKTVFRGKKVESGEWVFGDLVHVRDGDTGKITPNIVISHNHDTFEWIGVIAETIGQYTGIHDYAGAQIFEGDMLDDPLWDDEGIAYEDSQVVIYSQDHGAWCVDVSFNKDGSFLEPIVEYFGKEHLLVVGNIHDH